MALTAKSRTNNSTEYRNSRYVQGGNTEIYNNRLGWWERREIPKAYDDIKVTVGRSEANRPDLITHRLYQQPKLAWLVLQYNNIVDPVTELVPGAQLIMPSQSRLMLSILTKPTGGKDMTENT